MSTESGKEEKASGEEAQRLRAQAEALAAVLTGQFQLALSSSSNSVSEPGIVNTSPGSAVASPPRSPVPQAQVQPSVSPITQPIELPVVQPVVPMDAQPILPNPAPRVSSLSRHQMRWLEAELNHKIKLTDGSTAEATAEIATAMRHDGLVARAVSDFIVRQGYQGAAPRGRTERRRIDVPFGNGAMILRSHIGQ